MIRVLQTVNIMDRAGLETMLMNYYRNIDRSQVQFDFLTHRDVMGSYDKEILSLGGRIFRAPRLYPQNYIKYFQFMSKFFGEHPEYRIVHSHIDTMSVFPLSVAKHVGIPYRVGHSHNSKLDLDAKLPVKWLAKVLMPYVANVYCACGEKAGQFMYGGREIKIIHNAIDIRRFGYEEEIRGSVREKLGIKNSFVIGHVGRYCHTKNQVFLLEILKIVKTIRRDAVLLLVGKGKDEAFLRKKAEELGLKGSVLFLIDQENVNNLYQAMDVFVLPSLFEGLPVVGVEAQANGLPCLFSDRISREVMLTNTAEMMSITQPPEQWANKILSLRRSENENQKQLREKGYDVTMEAPKLMEWYQTLDSRD